MAKQAARKNEWTEIVPSKREAPVERQVTGHDVIMPLMSQAQMNLILNKTPEYAIKKRAGPGGTYKYIKHGYVADQLNKIFGFDWDLILTPMADGQMYSLQVEEFPVMKDGRVIRTETKKHLAVCGYIEARIHNKQGEVVGTLKKSGFGSQIWLPTTEFGDSLKGAMSDLLKVCAQRIGIGLDLYWDDDAELQRFEDDKRRSEEEEQLNNMLRSEPATAVVLISRAMNECGVGIQDLEKIAGATLAEIQAYDAGQIGQLWAKVQKNKVVDGKVEE